jgi:hypothetical protein
VHLAVDEFVVFVVAKDGEKIRWGEDKATGEFKGYAHTEFVTEESANKAVKKADFGGRSAGVRKFD